MRALSQATAGPSRQMQAAVLLAAAALPTMGMQCRHVEGCAWYAPHSTYTTPETRLGMV